MESKFEEVDEEYKQLAEECSPPIYDDVLEYLQRVKRKREATCNALVQEFSSMGLPVKSVEDISELNPKNILAQYASVLTEEHIDRIKDLGYIKKRIARIQDNLSVCEVLSKVSDGELIKSLVLHFNVEDLTIAAIKVGVYRFIGMTSNAEFFEEYLRKVSKRKNFRVKSLKNIFESASSRVPILEEDDTYEVYGYDEKRNIWMGFKGLIEIIPSGSLSSHIHVIFGVNDPEIVKIYRDNIREKAGDRGRLPTKKPLGQGIHRLGKYWVIVSGMKAISIHQDTLEKRALLSPIFQNRVLHMTEEVWLHLDAVRPTKAPDFKEVYSAIKGIVAHWEWGDKDAVPYITAAVMLILFQEALDWRPLIYLSGAQGTGKTIFAHFMTELFSGFCEVVDKTTAHAVKQTFGNNSRPGFLDEFEHHNHEKHIKDTLNLFKTSCRGGHVSYGTLMKESKKCYLNHMFFLASISFPRCLETDAALRERILTFHLNKKKGKFLILPPKNELQELGNKLVNTMLANWPILEKSVADVRKPSYLEKQTKTFGVSAREIDNFVWLNAVIKLGEGENNHRVVPKWGKLAESNDADTILEHILKLRLKSTALLDAAFFSDFVYLIQERILMDKNMDPFEQKNIIEKGDQAKLVLRQNYASVLERKDGEIYLALQLSHASNYLRKIGMFSGMDIKTILKRQEYIQVDTVRFGAMSAKSLLIPMSEIDRILNRYVETHK